MPITWTVPRKTYRDFHADIFPDTAGTEWALGPGQWAGGADGTPATISLDPASRPADLLSFPPPISERKYDGATAGQKKHKKPPAQVAAKEDAKPQKIKPVMRSGDSFLMPQVRPTSTSKPNTKASKFGRTTKFKHLKGTPLHKSTHFENLKNLSKSVAAECDIIHANTKRIVVPMAGPGGKVAVFDVAKAGRIPDGVMPCLINGATVLDFAWDPFNESRLVCVTEEGSLNLWQIPDGGLVEQTNQPLRTFIVHADKTSIVKFHPTAADILATAGYDGLVKVWNLADEGAEEKFSLEGHADQIYSMAWSQCGRFIATACKDGHLREHSTKSTDCIISIFKLYTYST